METSVAETQGTQQNITIHEYVEVSGDLLAKPDALAEVIEANRGQTIVIFCNAPSDADLIEALLRKRGIVSRKLIGNVPPSRISGSVAEIKNGEAAALIVTDVSGQSLNLNEFDISINFAMHSDPEVYLQRAGQLGDGSPKRAISFIGPLDITHFHYLKKVAGLEFNELKPPTMERIAAARVEAFRKQAQTKLPNFDEKTKAIAEYIITDPEVKNLVALLVHNSFEVPAPVASPAPSHHDRQGGHDRYRDRDDDGGGRQERRGRNNRRDDEGNGSGREDRRERNRDRTPSKKESRIYLGVGADAGFTEDALRKILDENCAEAVAGLKRFSARGNYAFFDLDEDFSGMVTTKLSDLEWKGEKLFVKEAIKIPVLRPREEQSEEHASSDEDAESSNTEDHDSDEDQGSDEE